MREINFSRNNELKRPTARELEILQLYANGFKAAEAANYMGIANATARKHTLNLLEKLQAKNRTHAVAIAWRRGWIQ